MSKTRTLLLGATGETGGDILEGLLEDGGFDVTCLIRPTSVNKPAVTSLKQRGINILLVDMSSPTTDIARSIASYETIISAIDAPSQLTQLSLVDAAALSGTVKRFVPCAFMTVCPPGGIMQLRDDKEVVYQRIWQKKLPYTIVDIGTWHQFAFPRVPSMKLDYAVLLMQKNEVLGTGNAKTMLTDKRDIGRFVARIIKDERTLNHKVFTYSDVISQHEAIKIVQEKTGESVDYDRISKGALLERLEERRLAFSQDPTNLMKRSMHNLDEYNVSRYIREDNTPENGKYLGYLDARELYPDFKPIRFGQFVDELVGGGGKRPYEWIWAALQESGQGNGEN